MTNTDKPLDGLLVLDFSLFLAGPLCALRLADLGARVIKIERPDGGDLCRQLYISEQNIGEDSTLFHAINRNKESFAANLKDKRELDAVRRLIAKADVLITNFRPGVMKRLGLDYPALQSLNPGLCYGAISGYGDSGPWKSRPGQDLLAQALSGVMWLSGNGPIGSENPVPVPMGLAVADMFAGHFLAQGLLALLVRRGKTSLGGLVETSLLEAMLDFQFEVLTTHLNDGGKTPTRSTIGNGHAYLSAPYGVYQTADGWIALAMNPLAKLAPLLELPELNKYTPSEVFSKRDEIKAIISTRLKQQSREYWMNLFETEDLWCAPILDWPTLTAHDAYAALKWPMNISHPSGEQTVACRCPIRINGEINHNSRCAPSLGEQTSNIVNEFNLYS